MGEFESKFAGKMNFYLAAVDDLVQTDEDNRPTPLPRQAAEEVR
jgi:hypothetical protein